MKNMHPYDLSLYYKELPLEERLSFCKKNDVKRLAEMFSYIKDAHEYLNELDSSLAAKIINEMKSDDATDVLLEMDEKILDCIDDDTKASSLKLIEYSENETGSITDLEYVAITPKMDVKEAMKKLVSLAPYVKNITTLFVVEDDILRGVLDFRKLISTKAPCFIEDIMNENYNYTIDTTDIEVTIEIIKDYDITILPVLKDNKMFGVVTVDDALYTHDNETSEDYAKFSAVSDSEEVEEKFILSVQKRAPWLLTLLILDVFVCLIISSFDRVIESATIIVLFQPMVLGLAGNAGTQSLAVSIRNISNEEVNGKEKVFKYLFKEVKIGILSGFILAILSFLLILLFLMIKAENDFVIISGIISLSVFISLIFSVFLGALLPLFFNFIHVDPAVASGPFITTINDILAIVIYFSLAGNFIINI